MSVRYYMERPAELLKQPDAAESFKRVAESAGAERAGDVFRAIWSFWNFEHALDDVLDSGKLPMEHREKILKNCADFVRDALLNPMGEFGGVWFKSLYSEAVSAQDWPEADKLLAISAMEDFAGNLIANPFYQMHAQQHLAMFDSMIFRLIAGDEMAASEDAKRQALAPAVRCGDVDFLVHVAKLAGGWDAARQVSSLRDYDPAD